MIHKNVKHFFYELRVKNSELVRTFIILIIIRQKIISIVTSSIKVSFQIVIFAQHFWIFFVTNLELVRKTFHNIQIFFCIP